MASMRKLRHQLLRWRRYGVKTTGDVRAYGWSHRYPSGYVRAMIAVNTKKERRFWAEAPEVFRDTWSDCDVCGLPDLHRGQGDGIGSCDCPRCDCGAARSSTFCSCDPACSYCLSAACEGDCDEAYEDDEPAMRVVTEWGLTEAGLL